MFISRLAVAALAAVIGCTAANAATVYTQLNSNQRMLPGDVLRSADGKYELAVKVDGSIARRKTGGAEFWNPGKFGQSLLFQWDGNLVLYDTGDQHAVWTIDKGVFTPQNYQLQITSDGSLNATAPDGHSIWYLQGDSPCPTGQSLLVYPACASPHTSWQYNTFVAACSYQQALQRAASMNAMLGACLPY